MATFIQNGRIISGNNQYVNRSIRVAEAADIQTSAPTDIPCSASNPCSPSNLFDSTNSLELGIIPNDVTLSTTSINNETTAITGTGEPLFLVSVVIGDQTYNTITESDGTWSIPIGQITVDNGDYSVNVTQRAFRNNATTGTTITASININRDSSYTLSTEAVDIIP